MTAQEFMAAIKAAGGDVGRREPWEHQIVCVWPQWGKESRHGFYPFLRFASGKISVYPRRGEDKPFPVPPEGIPRQVAEINRVFMLEALGWRSE